MSLNIRQTDRGAELTVKASPGSRKNAIRGVVDGALKISVTSVPEKGKANAAIIKLLSKSLKIAKSRIILVSGLSSSIKKLIVVDVDASELEQRLNECMIQRDD